MTTDEKFLTRILFDNKVLRSDGSEFEELFTTLMEFVDDQFIKIKAWGNIGDRKNDGCIIAKGIYYQVYAPEDIEKTQTYYSLLSKIEEDSTGLLAHWSSVGVGVKQYKFVVNDKFKGVHADAVKSLESIRINNKLEISEVIKPRRLEKKLMTLGKDEIERVLNCCIPNPNNIENLNYSILKDVINHIMNSPCSPPSTEIKLPKWEDKIKFNKLSSQAESFLNIGSMQLNKLNLFLDSDKYNAEIIQSKMTDLYCNIKEEYKDIPEMTGDHIFWELINRCIPQQTYSFQNAMYPILAKYFESCDIFEEPK